MAAKSKSTQVIASLGKHFVNRPQASPRATATAFSVSRKCTHSSAYDKNMDDQVRPAIVPDEVIQPQSDKYWSPHPKTGVFGPSSEHNTTTLPSGGGGFHSAASGSGDSVLEEKAWFRPTSLEDHEKTHHS